MGVGGLEIPVHGEGEYPDEGDEGAGEVEVQVVVCDVAEEEVHAEGWGEEGGAAEEEEAYTRGDRYHRG